MSDNARLGCHRLVERGIQCPRDIGQRDLAHLGEGVRDQLSQMHGRDFSFVSQGRRGIVKQGSRGRQDRDRKQSRQGDEHTGRQAQALHGCRRRRGSRSPVSMSCIIFTPRTHMPQRARASRSSP